MDDIKQIIDSATTLDTIKKMGGEKFDTGPSFDDVWKSFAKNRADEYITNALDTETPFTEAMSAAIAEGVLIGFHAGARASHE